MNNADALMFFDTLSKKEVCIETTKINKVNDFSTQDAEFIQKHTNKMSDVLDLATGTGITLNKYYQYVRHVVAVEKFVQFAKLIRNDPQIEVVISDLNLFKTDKKFDIITMFGIVSYFNEEEILQIYRKYKSMLKPRGKFLIKNQFGLHDKVEIEGFSEELQCNYYSQYRQLHNEIDILSKAGMNVTDTIDIYPAEYNRWNNTHFYAIIANNDTFTN